MPTQIHNPRQSSRERYFARQSVYRLASQSKFTEVLRAPWMGWVPDLPPHVVGWQGYRTGRGLVPFPYEGRGMTMRHDDGYERTGTGLPLGETAVGPPVTAPGQFAVTLIAQYFNHTTVPASAEINRIAAVAGDANNPVYGELYRQNPGTGAWTRMTPSVRPMLVADRPIGNRDALWDWCSFPFGAITRVPGIGVPLMVMCNSDYNGPVDDVLVTPDAVPTITAYDVLSLNAPGPGFKAASCESFNGRVHFINTIEVGPTYHPQRHRWSAIGTADPDAAQVGSGYLDLAEFQRPGKRIETLGDNLALYFGDGVAFEVPTGFYADAYRPQIVSRTRGLLGGQALCPLTPHLHFGIFNDGWWTLDSSGRWSKLGRLILEETRGKSHEMTKWEDSFYEDLDFDQTQRICCIYDRYREIIRIAYPSKTTSSENYTILNYHPKTDTCWQDRYSTPTTCWGVLDLQQVVGAVWGDDPPPPATGVPGTWDEQVIAWDTLAPQYQEDIVCHGNGPTVQCVWDGAPDWEAGYTLNGGLIFNRNPNLFTYDGRRFAIQYITHEINRNENPLLDQSFHRLGIEYISTDTGSALAIQVTTDEGANQGSQFLDISEGNINTVQTAYAHFRLHGTAHGFGIYGSAPVVIRSLVPELMLYSHDDREGQP